MLVKGKFLEKINYFIFINIVLFSQNLVGENIKSKIDNYNNNLKNSSAQFIQSDGETLEEGVFYFGTDRIKIDYIKPNKISLTLSEKKGMYTNHTLEETQYFNTKKSYIKFFFKILEGNILTEKISTFKNLIEIKDEFFLDDNQYKISIFYENEPLKLRKVIILENNNKVEIGFYNHNDLKFFEKNFFSMIDPYLN